MGMVLYGMVLNGHCAEWAWCCMGIVLYGMVLNGMVLYGRVLYGMVLNGCPNWQCLVGACGMGPRQ